MLCALFDPLGFVAPVSLLAKTILQNLCRKGIGWDESTPEVDREAWLKWVADLPALSRLRMPRCITHVLHLRTVRYAYIVFQMHL